MSKKILLVNPPYPFEESPSPPFGLMSLAGYLLEQGIAVAIEDYVVTPYSQKRVEKKLKQFLPDIVGSTAVTMNVNKAFSILKDYKEADPHITTVIGGPHVTFDAENALREHPYVDYVVRGEGEITLLELMNSLDRGEMTSIRGLSYRKGEKIVHNEQREFVEDINIFPYPARHLIQLGKYKAIGAPINMITSRGCPFQCIFCVGSKMVGRKVRYFDINRVVDEFELLMKLGFIQINISDDLFTSNKKRCIAICNVMIRRGINYPWGAFARVDTVSEELLEVMKKAGCRTLCFGIESGNQEILNTIKKKTTIETCRRAVAMCKKVGIQPMTSYILGLPGETAETVKETMEFAANLSPSYGFHILAPFPGTEVRDNCASYGLRILTSDWDKYDANQSVAETSHVTASEVNRAVNKFYNGIKSLVEKAAKQYDRKESLAEKDILMVEAIRSGIFTRDVIFKELVECYPGVALSKSGALFEDFVSYTMAHSTYDREYIKAELGKLLRTNCITSVSGNSVVRYQWT